MLTMLSLVVGVGFLWWYSAYQAAPVLAPSNPVFDDLEKEVLEHPGLKFEHFSFKGWDDHSVPAVLVQASGQVTPPMKKWHNKLSSHTLESLKHADYVLVSVEWDHGIVSALPLAEMLTSAGLKCVLWESRGEDDVRPYCTHGLRESQDVAQLITELERREAREGLVVIGVGRGFGAAMLLQAAALDSRLSAIIAIDSYASLSESLRRTISGSSLLRQAKMWLIDRQLEHKSGYEIFDVAPVESVNSISAEIPLLLVNLSDENAVVNLDDALNLYRQSPSEHKQIWTLRNARDKKKDTLRKVSYSSRKGESLEKKTLDVELKHNEEAAWLSMVLWADDAMERLLKEKHGDIGIQQRTSAVSP